MYIGGTEPWCGHQKCTSLLNARLLRKPAYDLEPPLVSIEPWMGAAKGQQDSSSPGSPECGGLWRLLSSSRPP